MIFRYIRLIKELLITDLIIMKQTISGTIINTLIWAGCVTAVSTYVFPQLGMTQAYGSMALISAIGSCGVFEIFGNTSVMVADLDGDKTISYQFTLPLPGWSLLIQKALAFAIHSAIISLFIIPLGKLLMGNQLILSAINPFKFVVAFCTLHLFFGFFALIMIAYTTSMSKILHVWTRLLFPLWFFGGSQYNWYTLKAMNPALAYASLANPLVYAFDAIKSASLSEGQYLPFWFCILMMVVFSALFTYIGHRKLQRRLDYL
jgi:hypothetical protein